MYYVNFSRVNWFTFSQDSINRPTLHWNPGWGVDPTYRVEEAQKGTPENSKKEPLDAK